MGTSDLSAGAGADSVQSDDNVISMNDQKAAGFELEMSETSPVDKLFDPPISKTFPMRYPLDICSRRIRIFKS
jgi:hypothetical protein